MGDLIAFRKPVSIHDCFLLYDLIIMLQIWLLPLLVNTLENLLTFFFKNLLEDAAHMCKDSN